jgi:hypothetical protein
MKLVGTVVYAVVVAGNFMLHGLHKAIVVIIIIIIIIIIITPWL